ncbi:hypothetical protein EBS67_04050 [bacterium]|nr:hypothetical protein [bacterium]NBT61019.1 hypothetical protein [Planctomycetia bacterium]
METTFIQIATALPKMAYEKINSRQALQALVSLKPYCSAIVLNDHDWGCFFLLKYQVQYAQTNPSLPI